MYGAIAGDFIGSPYEHHNIKTKDFPLFSEKSRLTDDSIMTIAVTDALIAYFEYDRGTKDLSGDGDRDSLKNRFYLGFRKWGMRYPNAGYGGAFYKWLHAGGDPYNSWGNGSAMRVSPVAWYFEDINVVREVARISAEVTHNHPEGVKGAEAIASAVFMARRGFMKRDIKDYIVTEFGYDLSKTTDQIRPDYTFDVSCQGSVPQAIRAFIDGIDFEDVVRNAVSIGGDSDTIACMAGAIAAAYYGMNRRIMTHVRLALSNDQLEVWNKNADLQGERVSSGNITGYVLPRAYRELPEADRLIGKHYTEVKDVYKTAEAFNEDVERVVQIAENIKEHSSTPRHRGQRFKLRDYLE